MVYCTKPSQHAVQQEQYGNSNVWDRKAHSFLRCWPTMYTFLSFWVTQKQFFIECCVGIMSNSLDIRLDLTPGVISNYRHALSVEFQRPAIGDANTIDSSPVNQGNTIRIYQWSTLRDWRTLLKFSKQPFSEFLPGWPETDPINTTLKKHNLITGYLVHSKPARINDTGNWRRGGQQWPSDRCDTEVWPGWKVNLRPAHTVSLWDASWAACMRSRDLSPDPSLTRSVGRSDSDFPHFLFAQPAEFNVPSRLRN